MEFSHTVMNDMPYQVDNFTSSSYLKMLTDHGVDPGDWYEFRGTPSTFHWPKDTEPASKDDQMRKVAMHLLVNRDDYV